MPPVLGAFFITLLSVNFNESISPLNHSIKKPSFSSGLPELFQKQQTTL
ncbi:hypothetical protein SAMN05421639_11134 [Chryseobacterium shigense]|uniref:Uncharacterized protein n=1 Tax=Chryseobacterium shigense TaxID=297244 RepID=A0A1N7KJ38_9FLAO|nr:hypothetical protein SAMN05421639_11134 [Chryseobacterium shigense]